jgi:hypothetical protein
MYLDKEVQMNKIWYTWMLPSPLGLIHDHEGEYQSDWHLGMRIPGTIHTATVQEQNFSIPRYYFSILFSRYSRRHLEYEGALLHVVVCPAVPPYPNFWRCGAGSIQQPDYEIRMGSTILF